MDMVNGYVFLDLTKSNVYAKALKVLGAEKPVIIKDGSGVPYFVDSLTLDGTNVVITKGGKTITIANDNTITNVGDIQPHLYRYDFDLFINNDGGDGLDVYFSVITNINDLDFESNTKLTNEILDKLPLYKGLSLCDDTTQNIVGFYEYDNSQFVVFGGEGSSITYTRDVDSDTIVTINKIQLF